MANSYAIVRVQALKDQLLASKRVRHRAHHSVLLAADGRVEASTPCDFAEDVIERVWLKTQPLVKRRDAVRCLEVVLTASPDWLLGEDRAAVMTLGAVRMLHKAFGVDNLAAMALHRGPGSPPYVWALAVPIYGGALCASRWLKGPAERCNLPDLWVEEMAPHGLVAGARGALAREDGKSARGRSLEGEFASAAALRREARVRATRQRLAQQLSDMAAPVSPPRTSASNPLPA